MSEEIAAEVAAQVAPAVAPVAEVPAQEPAAAPVQGEQLPPPPEEVPVAPEQTEAKKAQEALAAVKAEPDESARETQQATSTTEATPKKKFRPKKKVHADGKDAKASGPAPRKRVTNEERKARWREQLLAQKGYKDEAFIGALTSYALDNSGFDLTHFWGYVLIRMFNRLSYRLRTKVETFSSGDAEYLTKRIMQFMHDRPLGAGPNDWNTNYRSNDAQLAAFNDYFGLRKGYFKMSLADQILCQFRDAAKPFDEEARLGEGGTYAERLHYFAAAILCLSTTSSELFNAMFECQYHQQPPDEMVKADQKFEAERQARLNTPPKWVDAEGKCAQCGGDVVRDADGNWICQNTWCLHNIPPVRGSGFAKGGRDNGGQRPGPRNFGGGFRQPESAPGQRRDGKDRRHNRDDDEREFGSRPKHHGKRMRFHEGDFDGEERAPQTSGEDATVISTPGGDQLGSLAGMLDGIKLS